MINPTRLFYLSLLLVAFYSCGTREEISAWDVVDNDSVLILESKDGHSLKDKTVGPFFPNPNVFITSLQRLSKDDFGVMYSYALPARSYDSMLLSQAGLKGQKITNRLLNGIEISEVKNSSNEIQVAFTYLHGIFVLSKSSFLVENAIRVFESEKKKRFKSSNKELFQFNLLKSDKGNLYLNSNVFPEFPFGSSALAKLIPILNELKSLSVFDIKSNNDFLLLNGFSMATHPSLALFQNQKPVPFKIAKFVPNYSTALVHFGVSDFNSFNKIIDSAFVKKLDIGNEIAFASIEDSSKLLAFVEMKPRPSDTFHFNTAFTETYSNYTIRGVNGELLKAGFGKLFPTVTFNFCTVVDNNLFLSQSIADMKSLIDAIESDDTWGKTVEYQKFSERGLQESNVTLIFKSPDFFSDSSKNYAAFDSLRLQQVNWCSIQMSALDNHFYSNVNLSLSPQASKGTRTKNLKSSFVEFPGKVVFSALVKNHFSELNEVLVQDADLMVYLVSLRNGILWKRQLDGPIQDKLHLLDFYKNGKIQYALTTSDKYFIIDRLGRDVQDFPIQFPSKIKFSGLVDYDKSKNYRFLISSVGNEVSLLDKNGKNLSGWGPKKFETGMAVAPEHFKMGGKDFFLIFLADGTAHIYNRPGASTKTFQLREKESFQGDFYLESGIAQASTFIFYVSKDGILVKQNMKGDILDSDNLMRGKNSTFTLKRVPEGNSFFVFRTDSDKIVVFNKEGKVVFEKQNTGSIKLDFQCIETNKGKIVFSFYDTEQKFVQVFDITGRSLVNSPVDSDVPPLFGSGKSKSEMGFYSFPKNSIIFNTIRP